MFQEGEYRKTLLVRVLRLMTYSFCFYLYKQCYWWLYCCSLSLLFSSVFVPNRLMMIICADHALIAGFQHKNGRECAGKERDIAAFEVVPLSKPISAYCAGCTL